MVTPSSPFSFLDDFINRVGSRLQPPDWVIHEAQHRAVLFLNHVLQQEPEAQQRLARQQGRVVEFEWRFVTMKVIASHAASAVERSRTTVGTPDPGTPRPVATSTEFLARVVPVTRRGACVGLVFEDGPEPERR